MFCFLDLSPNLYFILLYFSLILKKTIYKLTYLIILVDNINTASKLLKASQDASHERVTTLKNLKYEIEHIFMEEHLEQGVKERFIRIYKNRILLVLFKSSIIIVL